MTLTPAYGRDYKSKAAVAEDWQGNRDWCIADVFHPDCGRHATREELAKDFCEVRIRYDKLRKVCVADTKTGKVR
jgi:hypothetical protein